MSQQNCYLPPTSLCSLDENIEEPFSLPRISGNPIEISGQDSLYTVRTCANEGSCVSNSITSGYFDIDTALIGVGSHIQVDPGGYGTFGDDESETGLEDKLQMADNTTHRHPGNQGVNNEGLPWGIRRKNSMILDATETDSPVTSNNEVELFQGSSSFMNSMFPLSNTFYSTVDASVGSGLDAEGPWSWNFDSLEPVYWYGEFMHQPPYWPCPNSVLFPSILSQSPGQDAIEIGSTIGWGPGIQTINGSLSVPAIQGVLSSETRPDHNYSIRRDPNIYRCSIDGCSKTFERRSELNKHKKTHLNKSDRPHSCSSCPVKFLYSKDLERHYRSKHADLRTVAERHFCPVSGCKFASKGFARKDKKKQHIENTHVKRRPSTSRSASRGPSSPTSLRNEKAHPCTFENCSRPEGFDTLHDLARHQRSLHGRLDKAYRCMSDGCKKQDKIWPRLDNFRKHVLNMHPSEDPDALIERSRNWDTDIFPPSPVTAGNSASPLIMTFYSRVPQKHCAEDSIQI